MVFTPTDANRVTLEFEDPSRVTAITGFYLDSAASIDTFEADQATLLNDFQALSDGGLVSMEATLAYKDPTKIKASSSDPLGRVETKATMVFKSLVGAAVKYAIPAPITAIFEIDQKTINSAATAVAAFITDILANAVDKANNSVVEYIKGYRNQKKNQKKAPGANQF